MLAMASRPNDKDQNTLKAGIWKAQSGLHKKMNLSKCIYYPNLCQVHEDNCLQELRKTKQHKGKIATGVAWQYLIFYAEETVSSLNNDHGVKYLPKPISLSCHDLTLLEGLPFQQFCKLKLQTHLWLWQSYLHLSTKVSSFPYFCSD